MFGNLNGWHLIIVLAVILLLFGAAKLPALAKSLGQSARVFKGEMKAMKEEDAESKGDAETPVDSASGTAVRSDSSDPDSPRSSA